jgi:hypothetical protein
MGGRTLLEHVLRSLRARKAKQEARSMELDLSGGRGWWA